MLHPKSGQVIRVKKGYGSDSGKTGVVVSIHKAADLYPGNKKYKPSDMIAQVNFSNPDGSPGKRNHNIPVSMLDFPLEN